MIVPSGIAYLTLYYPNFRTKIAIVMGIGYISMSLGPSIGSYMINEYSWRSIFIACLPLIGIAIIMIAISSYPGKKYKGNRSSLPSIGYFFKSINRDFYASIIFGSIFNILLLGVIFTFPLLLMKLYNYSIIEAGNCFLIIAVFVAGGSLFAGKIDKRYEFFILYIVVTFLIIVTSLCIYKNTLTAFEFIALYTFLGLVLGFSNSLALIANQTILPKDIVGFGSGMFKTITTLAGAFGVALIGTWINEILDQKSIQISLKKEYMATFFVALSLILMLNFKKELHKIKNIENIEIGR